MAPFICALSITSPVIHKCHTVALPPLLFVMSTATAASQVQFDGPPQAHCRSAQAGNTNGTSEKSLTDEEVKTSAARICRLTGGLYVHLEKESLCLMHPKQSTVCASHHRRCQQQNPTSARSVAEAGPCAISCPPCCQLCLRWLASTSESAAPRTLPPRGTAHLA